MDRWSHLFASRAAMATASDRTANSASWPSDLSADAASGTDAVVAYQELRSVLGTAIESLPRRDGQIVVLYHRRGATPREIGRLFNLNERRVSQIHKRALERMAAALQSLGITSSSSILWR